VVTEELAGGESPLQLHSWAIEPVAKVPFWAQSLRANRGVRTQVFVRLQLKFFELCVMIL